MSTRATYLFKNAHSDRMDCMYIHYDGYPEGAAKYFYNMAACDNTRGGLGDRFFRGNDLAELTDSHAAHGDTEYRYTCEADGMLTVTKRIDFSDQWQVIWEGHWADFANYGETVKMVHKIGNRVLTVSAACEAAITTAKEYAHWISQGMRGNAGSKDIDALQIAYELNDSELMAEVERICAEGRRKYVAA